MRVCNTVRGRGCVDDDDDDDGLGMGLALSLSLCDGIFGFVGIEVYRCMVPRTVR